MPEPSAEPDDAVDAILRQWAAVRPDLDLAAMGTFGRLGRLHVLGSAAIGAVFAAYDLGIGEFDVLAALRRGGPPHAETPGALARTLMLSPAGMTGRIDRLEAAGWVRREADPEDRRSLRVVLTEEGLELVDQVVAEHVANEERLLSVLDREQRAALDDALRALLRSLDG